MKGFGAGRVGRTQKRKMGVEVLFLLGIWKEKERVCLFEREIVVERER